MLLYISILSLGFFYVKGAPQLKLGHSGYEIISFNDQNPDDSVPLASKLSTETVSKSNGVDGLTLEKATDPIDEDDEFSLPLQQHKRHYGPQRSSPGPKLISESQLNLIDVPSKQSASQKPNIYLTVGIPRTFAGPSTVGKEAQAVIPISEKTNSNHQPKDSLEDSDSREDSGNQEKHIAKSIRAKISDKTSKSGPAAKLSKQSTGKASENIRNQVSDGTSDIFESDLELPDLKDEEKISALLADAHRATGLIDVKSAFQDKEDNVEPPAVKPGFTMVTHFPSIQIHHQKISDKGPAVYSPIYPSGFDILAGKPYKKSSVPIKDLLGRHLRVDHKIRKTKKHVEMGLEDRKNRFFNHDINHDLLIPKTRNIMSFPISVSPINIQPFSYLNQQPLKSVRHEITHIERNPMSLVTSHLDNSLPVTILRPQGRWERMMPRTSIDLQQQGNDLDREYLDSNQVVAKSEFKADFLKNYMGSFLNPVPTARNVEQANELLPPNGESSKGLLIGIVHEVAPDDSQETVIDVKKDGEMHDASQTHSSASSKNSCKQMKPGTPALYEFLAKFSNILLDKALQYEFNTQTQINVAKLMENTKNKNPDKDDNFGSTV